VTTVNSSIMNRDTTGMGGEDVGKSTAEIRLERKQKLAAALRLFGKSGFDEGVVLDSSEGERIASALGEHKAAILQNHGLLTVGATVDEAAWFSFQPLYEVIVAEQPELMD
jgi:hypothetical protein